MGKSAKSTHHAAKPAEWASRHGWHWQFEVHEFHKSTKVKIHGVVTQREEVRGCQGASTVAEIATTAAARGSREARWLALQTTSRVPGTLTVC